MTPKQAEIFAEIQSLLFEAYDDYFEKGGSGHKSAEGTIEIGYPNYFTAGDYHPFEANFIRIYSYALGRSRWHEFDTFEEALEEVREWHREQLEWDPEGP